VADTFSDLPDALVRDLLAQATPVAERVSTHLNRLRQARGSIRQHIQAEGLIARKADLDVPRALRRSTSVQRQPWPSKARLKRRAATGRNLITECG